MRKTRILQIWAICIALVGVLFGCAKDSDNSGDTDGKGMYVTVKMPTEASGADTRAGLDNEVAIKQAYIIVYASGAVDADMPKYAAKIELTEIKDDGVNTKKLLAFKPTDNITNGDEVNVIFNKEIANLAVSKKDMLASLKLTSATGLVALNEGLPMYGSGKWTSAGSPIIKVNRSVAKIQLKLDYKGGTHVPGSKGASYTVANTTYKLYQLSDRGNINGADVGVTTNNPITDITNIEDIKEVTSIFSSGDNYLGANYIYAYPYSTKSIGTTPTPIDNKASSTKRFAMIMKNMDKGVASYHRLDLYDQSTKAYLDVTNNYHYTIKVREVDQQGYDTATKALMGPASNVRFDIVVEDEGTVIVSNGQYVLNVNELGVDFTASAPAISIIELAKVNRVAPANASMEPLTDFYVELHDITTVSGAATVTLANVPAKLGKDIKSLNISVYGEGVTTFRYTAKIGNIIYTSGLIKVTHLLIPVVVEGFCPSAGRPNRTILKGHDIHELLGVTNATHTITNVTSTFNKDWDAMVAVSETINNTPTAARWDTVNNGMSVSVSATGVNNKVYLHPFRTSPGEADIKGFLTVKGKQVSDNTPFTLVLSVKIVTSCKLPTKSDNYTIAIDGFRVSDRNVGSKLPTIDYPTANKYFTNQTDHRDYIKGSIGGPSYDKWSKQKPEISAIAGEYYAHTPNNSMANAHYACDTLSLGSGAGTWRLPDEGDPGKAELTAMNRQIRHSKYRVYILSTVSKSVEGVRSTFSEYSGVFLPIVGFSNNPTSSKTCYWSGSTSGSRKSSMYINTSSSYIADDVPGYGLCARCVSSL